MRAIVHTRYGPPADLRVTEIEHPALPEDGYLVRVRAASVNALDWHTVRGLPHLVRTSEGLRKPRGRVMGVDVAGIVEAAGPAAAGFAVGDEVIGHVSGAFADIAMARPSWLVTKPAGIPFDTAATLPVAGLTAIQALRGKADVQAGDRVLVLGAGGGVGMYAVQVAKALGAEVVATTGPDAVTTVLGYGADAVHVHGQEADVIGGGRFDAVLDIGGQLPLARLGALARDDGRVVLVAPGNGNVAGPVVRIAAAALRSRLGGPTLAPLLSHHDQADLQALRDWLASGAIRPVVAHSFPLERAGEAIALVERGGVRGKVVLTVA